MNLAMQNPSGTRPTNFSLRSTPIFSGARVTPGKTIPGERREKFKRVSSEDEFCIAVSAPKNLL
jgi:hypothetical protein